MATQESIAVQIQNRDQKNAPGSVLLEKWSSNDRMKRAIRALVFCWGGAVVAIFIPLLHFVLVPSLLIAGPIVAYVMYQPESVILEGKGSCPSCGAEFKIVRQKDRWPLKDICSHCQAEVEIYR